MIRHKSRIAILIAMGMLCIGTLVALIMLIWQYGAYWYTILLLIAAVLSTLFLVRWVIGQLILARVTGNGLEDSQSSQPFKTFHLFPDQYVCEVEKYRNQLEQQYNNMENINQIKFAALQNQINPHFLYNTLEVIRGLAYIEGAEQAAEMCQSLAAFFRYNVSHSDNIVTLEKEINILKNYFVIQKYRFSNRFILKLDIEEGNNGIMQYRIPKLMLQPIVENALFHGLEKRAGNGIIRIEAHTMYDRLYIHISDNGVGMTEEQVDALNKRLMDFSSQQGPEEPQRAGGVALVNINQRIRHMYGSEYGLNFASTYGEGTDVEIVLPFSRDEGW